MDTNDFRFICARRRRFRWMTNWHSHAVLFVCALPVLVIALGLALLVRPGFEPVPRLDVLPKIGGYVVARAIVEGVRK